MQIMAIHPSKHSHVQTASVGLKPTTIGFNTDVLVSGGD